MARGGLIIILIVTLGFLWPSASSYSTLYPSAGYSSNGSSCGLTLKALSSDPAAQSGVSSILLTSAVDASLEFLCSSGSSYDATGITCYALKCPGPLPAYGSGYGAQPGPYGAQSNQPGYGGQSARYGAPGPISVGPQVVYVETAYGCWKLKQIRLNTYVYLVCFIDGHPSTLYQVVFKENGMELVNYDTIPYRHLNAVGRATFPADNQLMCVAAVYSTSGPKISKGDHIWTEYSDPLAPIYMICPNNYKWYFCGNINIKDTIDASSWYAQSAYHVVFVQVRQQLICGSTDTPTPIECAYTTPLIQYTISLDADRYQCDSSLKSEILAIGAAPLSESENITGSFILRGVTTCTIVANNNATLLCCAVDAKANCPTDPASTKSVPSSFCIPYNTNTNKFETEKVIFLIGSEHSTNIQFTRANGECCQFIVTNGPAQSVLFYSLPTIITQLNNITQTNSDALSISPVHLEDDHIFNSAVTCSTKVKCCGTQQTCITCTRPTKYNDKYLAELSCPSSLVIPPLYASGYDDGIYGSLQQQRSPYGPVLPSPSVPYGRPANYSNQQVIYHGPQVQLSAPSNYAGPAPYNGGLPQQPVYGLRYN